jgi:hypothetical protein
MMATRGFFGDLHDALTGSGPYYFRRLNACEVRVLAFTYQPLFAQPPRKVVRQAEDATGTIVLPIHVDADDDYFLEWFYQSAKQEPVRLDAALLAKAIGTSPFTLGRCFEGWVPRDGCLFDSHSRTIELVNADHETLVRAATSLCREIEIPCLLFRDFSPKTAEFYLVRRVDSDAASRVAFRVTNGSGAENP